MARVASVEVLPGRVRDLRVPASARAHDGFRAWVTSPAFPEGVRPTFVAGEVLLDMSPEALEAHNQVKLAVTFSLFGIARAEDLGQAYADGMFLTHRAAEVSTEPDFAFATWDTLQSGRLRRVPRPKKPDCVELEGTPDVVVEIVSDSSTRKDTKLLLEGYARAGVPEYWLIDARGSSIAFQILRLVDGRYASPASKRSPQSSDVFGRRFSLRRRRNRMGGWVYELTPLAAR